ncbi:F-box/kelch-repeat protein At3g23880-like [Papaver somniferum]|uniref:F-box/kelch-repeat protein At3g23880-like n=1 Tax=Papaver somniferum TaxID=3469 RepID=UPI000E700396|nr:F-box/kelch-repeat protein At3g23880-like [Papaver somniferum]
MGWFNILPNDIMLEILTRLPTESVLDCKLVCTTWNNLAHHPSFSRLHLNRLLISAAIDSGKFSFIVLSRERGIREMSYGEYDDDDCHDTIFSRITMIILSSPFVDYSFVGSCNGLVCFNALLEDEGGYIYICMDLRLSVIRSPGNILSFQNVKDSICGLDLVTFFQQ